MMFADDVATCDENREQEEPGEVEVWFGAKRNEDQQERRRIKLKGLEERKVEEFKYLERMETGIRSDETED